MYPRRHPHSESRRWPKPEFPATPTWCFRVSALDGQLVDRRRPRAGRCSLAPWGLTECDPKLLSRRSSVRRMDRLDARLCRPPPSSSQRGPTATLKETCRRRLRDHILACWLDPAADRRNHRSERAAPMQNVTMCSISSRSGFVPAQRWSETFPSVAWAASEASSSGSLLPRAP